MTWARGFWRIWIVASVLWIVFAAFRLEIGPSINTLREPPREVTAAPKDCSMLRPKKSASRKKTAAEERREDQANLEYLKCLQHHLGVSTVTDPVSEARGTIFAFLFVEAPVNQLGVINPAGGFRGRVYNSHIGCNVDLPGELINLA